VKIEDKEYACVQGENCSERWEFAGMDYVRYRSFSKLVTRAPEWVALIGPSYGNQCTAKELLIFAHYCSPQAIG
jgi:hypothetical protein